MITINRAFHADGGLVSIDPLSGYVFTSESEAHEFRITKYAMDSAGVESAAAFNGVCTAYFLRADDIAVHITGTVDNGVLSVTLDPECYAVPGRFLLTIFNTVDDVTTCVYACTASVLRTSNGNVLIADGTISDPDASIGQRLAHWVAIYARNISELEANAQEVQEAADAVNYAISDWEAMVTALTTAVENANLKVLNTPNLIRKQPEGVSVSVPSGTVVEETLNIPAEDTTAAAETLTFTVTNEAITSAFVLQGIKSSNTSVVYYGMATAVTGSGSATVSISARSGAHDALTVKVFLCAVESALVPYGEISRHYMYNSPIIDSSSDSRYIGDEQDEISERIVSLTGNNIVSDLDGVSYNSAVAFTVQNAPSSGYDNADMLVFNYGNSSYKSNMTYNAGIMGEFPELVVGHKYTLSCWARITSGTKARLKFVYGNKGGSSISYYGESHFVEIENTTWERVYWTFTFNPTGDQYYNLTSGNTTYYCQNWGKKVAVGVCRKYNGTVQLCGFRLTAGELWANGIIDQTIEDLVDVAARVTSAENRLTANDTSWTNLLSSIAPVENGNTASANYAADALIVWKGKLYKAAAAIASGETFSAASGGNLTETTLAAELAALLSS